MLPTESNLVQFIALVAPVPSTCDGVWGHAEIAFGENDQSFSKDIVLSLLDRLTDDLLGSTM